MVAPATRGDTVRVHYTGTLDDGFKFDSSYDHGEPLELVIGQGRLAIGFETAVIDMVPGESKKVRVPSALAYGPHIPEKVIEASRSEMPEGLEQEIGVRVQGSTPDGQTIEFTMVGFTETEVILDGNHPLAGKDLNFEILLVEIVNH